MSPFFRLFFIGFFFSFFPFSFLFLNAAEKIALPLPPRLATTPAEWQAWEKSPDFEKAREEAVKSAEKLLQNPPPIPDESGSWIFYYANPRTGGKLVPLSPKEHKDPATGEIFTDEKIVAAYRGILHTNLDRDALKLAWGYAYTNNAHFAEGVRRILLKLATDYPTYPKRLDRWGRKGWLAALGGRRYVQSLDEAYGIISLAKAYDLTRTSDVYTSTDRKKIEKDLFRATVDTLLWFNQGINNHQTWYNAGLMSIASVLGDTDLAEKVLHMHGGYFDQLENSIGDDGLWYEGSTAYHLYALKALTEIVDSGQRMGQAIGNEPKLKKMFLAPLHLAYPNGIFPAINDSDRSSISSFDAAWKWGWEKWKDPQFAQALAKGDPEKLNRLTGKETKVVWPLIRGSEILQDAGLAVLRTNHGRTQVILDFGAHGGGHGHFDKLNLMIFANGREWLLDPGRLTYSHKEYTSWAKTTAAHNTVAINTTNQRPTTGKLLHFYFDDATSCSGVTAESNDAYPETQLTRSLFLTPQFLIDVFSVSASQKQQVDLLFHANAKEVVPVLPDSPAWTSQDPGTKDGYAYFTKGQVCQISDSSIWDFLQGEARLRIHFTGDPHEEIFRCYGIGYHLSQKTPTLIRRRNTQATRFISVYDLSEKGDAVQHVSAMEKPDAIEVAVSTTSASLKVSFGKKDGSIQVQK